MFKSTTIVARTDKRQAMKLAEKVAQYLQGKRLEVHVEETLAEKMGITMKKVSLGGVNTDFIITIGGDGTILRTCSTIPKPEPPILAVNMGVRGFLTETEPRQVFSAIDRCLKGQFIIEKCMKLVVTSGDDKFPDALNEVLLSVDEPAKLIYARILKDKEPILSFQAAALLIATQTGSTGYSLSAGGPVLDPSLNAFVLTPVCALGLFRPIIFPSNSSLTIEISRPRKILAVVDGHYRQIISSRTPSLTVSRSKYATSFIRFTHNFYDRLRSRLLLREFNDFSG